MKFEKFPFGVEKDHNRHSIKLLKSIARGKGPDRTLSSK